MPEDNTAAATTTAAEAGTSTTTAETATYSPPQTQADLDRIVSERLSREKAKFADYADLKKKAAEFDQLTEAQKSEAQKASDRATAAEAAAASAAGELARYKVAAAKGVPAELLAGATEEELNAHADQLIAYATGKAPRSPSFDGGSRTTAAAPQDMNDLIRSQLRR